MGCPRGVSRAWWMGSYIGYKYREDKESQEKEIVHKIAIKALKILRSYSGKSYGRQRGTLISWSKYVTIGINNKQQNQQILK